MSFHRNILTGKDNITHDIMRFAVYMVSLLFVVLIVWGIIMVSLAFFIDRPFDLTAVYTGFSIIISAFGAFLLTGAGSIYVKRNTEPEELPLVVPPKDGKLGELER